MNPYLLGLLIGVAIGLPVILVVIVLERRRAQCSAKKSEEAAARSEASAAAAKASSRCVREHLPEGLEYRDGKVQVKTGDDPGNAMTLGPWPS